MTPTIFDSTDHVDHALRTVGYLPTEEINTAVLLATRLERPLLAEGPAGTGKTALARALAAATGARLIRLQCHEAIDESRALYEWDYRKQLLSIQSTHDSSTTRPNVYSEDYLLVRPLLEAVRTDDDIVLLVDEVDRLSIEAEALLLEFLAERQITIPELGTITAQQSSPVILTSNDTRQLSEALRRRCMYLHIDYPDPQHEQQIISAEVPELTGAIVEQIAIAASTLRSLELQKKPSTAEVLDWAKSLALFPQPEITLQSIQKALPLLLKTHSDIAHAHAQLTKASSHRPPSESNPAAAY